MPPAPPSSNVELKFDENKSEIQDTSSSLRALADLLRQAEAYRATTMSELAKSQHNLRSVEKRLRQARMNRGGRDEIQLRTQEFEQQKTLHQEYAIKANAYLEQCAIDLSIAVKEELFDLFAELSTHFGEICRTPIWDVMASAQANEHWTRQHRSNVTGVVSRSPAMFFLTDLPTINSDTMGLFFGNQNGPAFTLYPLFLYVNSSPFALLDLSKLEVKSQRISFVEDLVPAGGKVIGQTWYKVNRDGTPDRRFKGNYQLSIVEYLELTLWHEGGLNEVYHLLDVEKGERLASLIKEYLDLVQSSDALPE